MMNIKTIFKRKLNSAEQSRDLHGTCKPWLSVFILIFTVAIFALFASFQDEILLAEDEIDVVYSLSAVEPSYNEDTVVKISSRGQKSNQKSGGAYTFMTDTGYTMFLLSFQEKEVYTVGDSLEESIDSMYDPGTQLLSGYTVTKGFSDLGFKDGTVWKSLGKIYAEYGTLGLTGVDATNKQTLISNIIETDFKDVTGLDAVSNIELLNGLAYRSNVITDELLARALIYVPRDAAMFDYAMEMPITSLNTSYSISVNFDMSKSPTSIAPYMNSFINKLMWAGQNPNIRIKSTYDYNNFYGSNAHKNYQALLTSTKSAFNPDKDGKAKKLDREHIQRAIAFAWPILTNKLTDSTSDYGPQMAMNDEGEVICTYINPKVNASAPDANTYWTSPFFYNYYIIEDTHHKGSAGDADFIKNTAATLDSDEKYLAKYKTEALNEEQLHEDLLLYYTENPDMAYAVLDAVFGNIKEYPLVQGYVIAQSTSGLLEYGIMYPHTIAATPYINFEERMTTWLDAGIDNYPETDVNRNERVAGIRQAELNCALAYILKEVHPDLTVDSHSNIEIRLINVYTNTGILHTPASVANDAITDEEKATKAEFFNSVISRIKNEGWLAWDAILGTPGAGYCTTYETIASNYYDYGSMASNRTKITTLAASSIGYAKNNKLILPTTDGKQLTVGGIYKNDFVLDVMNALGSVTFGREYADGRFVAGVDKWYSNSGFNTTDLNKANLAPTSVLRQSYLQTLFARATSASGTLDMIFNYTGMYNVGFGRETSSSNIAFTGINRDSIGTNVQYLKPNYSKFTADFVNYNVNKVLGLSKYQISLKADSSDGSIKFGTAKLKFNNVPIALLNSLMANAQNGSSSKTIEYNGSMVKLSDLWSQSQNYTSTAGSFAIRSAIAYNPYKFAATPSSDEKGYIIATSLQDRYPYNNDCADTCVAYSTGGLQWFNGTANNLFKTAFSIYNPSADTIGKLNENETKLIEEAQKNTVAAYGYFCYLYNRTYYQKADKVEVHAVLGFRDKESTDYTVTHICNPEEISSQNMVLGINLSKDTLNYLKDVIGESDTTYAQLTISLGGMDSGKLGYLNAKKTAVLASKFDTSLLVRNDNRLLSIADFGLIKDTDVEVKAESFADYIKAQQYATWENRTVTDKNYISQTLGTNTSTESGSTFTVIINKSDIEAWLEDDKYNTDATFQNSDTEFMKVVAEWPAELFAGENGKRLSTVESTDKLGMNMVYTFGVECQLNVVMESETDGTRYLVETAVLGTDTLEKDTTFYTNVGTGLYSGLYATSGLEPVTEATILALRDAKLMPDNVSNINEYFTKNIAYGEGTDNHVYFSFSYDELDSWQFKGSASLSWVNASSKTAQGKENEALGDTITSVMTVEYEGGETTIADLYNTLKAENVEYIVVSIGENSDTTEGTFEPTSPDDVAQLNDLSVLVSSNAATSALQSFNSGSIIYTLDQFVELLGGKDSTDTNATIQLKDYFVNNSTAGLTGVLPKDSPGAGNFSNTRLEYSFLLSVYAIGKYDDFKTDAEADIKNLGAGYVATVYYDNTIPLFDVTKGLSYILTPMTADELAGDTSTNVRYTSAMARELANLGLKTPDSTITAAETVLYDSLKDETDVVVWTPVNSNEGLCNYLNSVDRFEGHGLRNKHFGVATLGDDLVAGKDAWVATKVIDVEEPIPGDTYILRTSAPISYTQLKNGSWTNGAVSEQTWNVLTGIPSTETFYITSGGSEFIIEMTMSDLAYEHAYRSYISYFASNDCKFKPGDTASAGGGSVTAVNKNRIVHELNNTAIEEVVQDKFNLPAPTGNSGGNWTVQQHGGQTIWAEWTGTISNTTADPSIEGYVPESNTLLKDGIFKAGTQGKMVANGQEKSAGSYSWDINAYNTALTNAMKWARTYEEISNGEGNVIIYSDSDRRVRSWHAGEAVITVKFNGMTTSPIGNEHITKAHTATDFSGTYTSSAGDETTLTLKSNDERLSSGWFEVWGTRATFSCSGCTVLCKEATQTDPENMDNPEYYCEACYKFGNKTLFETATSTKYNKYEWDGITNSKNPGVTTIDNTITGHLLWCGENWHTNYGTDSSWSNACGKVYHEHTTGGCNTSGCTHDHDSSCCSKCKNGTEHTTCNHTVCKHKHNETAGACCSKEVHTHSTSCVKITNIDHEQLEHTHANTNTSVVKTTTTKAPNVTYSIKVTFKNSYTKGEGQVTTGNGVYPAHSLCGPCCSHVLPAIADEWVQWIGYSTIRISDIRVSKISRVYVEGQNDLTLDFKNEDYLIGGVAEGDVNIFYNIATENATYKNSYLNDRGGYQIADGGGTVQSLPGTEIFIDGASQAGRIRHSLQAQQHDKVLWREYNQLNEEKRTSECDGQAATKNYNPSPDGGTGHNEEWALGILYKRSNSSGDTYYRGTADEAKEYNTNFTHAVGWLTGNGNGEFDKAVKVVEGDKSTYSTNTLDAKDKDTWEYERFVYRRELENNVAVLTDTLIIQGTKKGDYKILYQANISAGKTTEMDHDKEEDGLNVSLSKIFGEGLEEKEYIYSGQGEDVEVTYHILENISSPTSTMFGGYNGSGGNDSLANHAIIGGKKVTTLLDSSGGTYDATKTHTDEYAKVKNAQAYTTVQTINDSLNANLYKTSAALYQRRIARPVTSLRIGQLNIQIDPTMQNHLYETEKSTQTWFQILNYTEDQAEDLKTALDKEYYAANNTVSDYASFEQESYYYGSTSTGFLGARYKVNDILIHSPISSENNFVLQDADFFDQRNDKVNMSNDDTTKTCPSSAILCEYSYFDCKYLEEITLLNLTFDEYYTRVDSNGEVSVGKAFATDTYGYIVSITDIVNYVVVPVKTGLVTKIDSDTYGSGINVNGTTLNIPLDTIDAQYTTGTKIKLSIQGQFTVNTTVFECGDIKAVTQSNGIKVMNGTKSAYVFYFNNPTYYHNYEFTIDYDGLDGFGLKVDGKTVNKSLSTPTPDEINVQFNEQSWSKMLKIGERCKLYNIAITHLPGTLRCTDGCYDNQFECLLVPNYTCDVATKFTGTELPHKYTAAVAGTYLLELYDNAGNYQSKKVYLEKGQSIYAYLGNKGYWSYSGTDKGYTTKETQSYTDMQIGTKDATILNPAVNVLDKTSGTGSVTLTPGIYYLEAGGDAGTASKGGRATGWIAVKKTTTYYYSVGENTASSWINSTNSSTNSLVYGGNGAISAVPGIDQAWSSGSGAINGSGTNDYGVMKNYGTAAYDGYVTATATDSSSSDTCYVYIHINDVVVATGSRNQTVTANFSAGDTVKIYARDYDNGSSWESEAYYKVNGVAGVAAATSYYKNVQTGTTAENVSDNGYVRIDRYVDASSEKDLSDIEFTASTTIINPMVTPSTVLNKTSGTGSVQLTPGIYYINAAGQASSAGKGGLSSGWLLVKSTGTYYYSVNGTTWFNSTNSKTNALALAGKGATAAVLAEQEITYTGSPTTVTLAPSTYIIEAWGAQGGKNTNRDSGTAKYGGYIKGTYTVDSTTSLYVVVGGKGGDISGGIDGSSSKNYNGGYNGGGSGAGTAGPGGGGATHIQIGTTGYVIGKDYSGSSSNASSYKGTAANISNLLLIAGGGGAGSTAASGTVSYVNGDNGTSGWYSDDYQYDTGGGGAGYKGGSGGSGDDTTYGASGTSWLDTTKLTNTSSTTGSLAGNGKVKITDTNGGSAAEAAVTSFTNNLTNSEVVANISDTQSLTITKYVDLTGIASANIPNDLITQMLNDGTTGGAETVIGEYSYTGNIQSVTLTPGEYKLEVWGAQGGTDVYEGGLGGYSTGTYKVTSTKQVFVVVGGQGSSSASTKTGGYNGGGKGGDGGGKNYGAAGGGATHIATATGLLSALSSNKSAVLIVAGGGGGADGNDTSSVRTTSVGGGTNGGGKTGYIATQTTGYAFGQGQDGHSYSGGGGGGYYGGYTAAGTTGSNNSGGGGSGYVGGVTDGVTTAGQNAGNGKAKITRLASSMQLQPVFLNTVNSATLTTLVETSINVGYNVYHYDADTSQIVLSNAGGAPIVLEYTGASQIITLEPGTYHLETWGASIGSGAANEGNYTAGTVTLDKTTTLYVYVGQQGTTDATAFNNSTTDIRVLAGFWYNAESLASRILVAGNAKETSYVSGHTGCDTTYLPNQKVNGTNVTFSNVIMQQGGHVGNGKVRITKVDSNNNIINTTIATTTTCPVESPYYWFLLAQRTNVAQIRLAHDNHTESCNRVVNTLNTHTHTTDCIGGTVAYDYLLYAAANNLPNLNELCIKYLGKTSSSIGTVYAALVNKTLDLNAIPDSVDGYDNPILNCYNHNTEHIHTISCKVNNKTSICNNVHHQDKCYELGHPLCYSPCNDNEKHRPSKVTIEGVENYIGSTVNLNGYFTVYWDNIGDFADTGDTGSLIPTSEKGQGFEDNMDTTRWLKRKVIIFNYIDVLFFNESTGSWELYLAGEEINLPIVTDDIYGNGDDDEKRDWLDEDTTDGIVNLELKHKAGLTEEEKQNLRTITSYAFYCLLNNNEYEKTIFQAWTEALNSPSSEGQGNEPYAKEESRKYSILADTTNFKRGEKAATYEKSFTALHSTRQYHMFDVVGQIGNLIVTYTTDPRWSNFFKQADVEAGWQMENLLYEIVEDDQERYLYIGREDNGTFKDIRNHEVRAENLFFDTWNNEAWKHTAVPMNAVLEPDLLAAQTNYTWSKLAEELKCGYDIYCEITTTGDYTNLDVEFKYYAFDTYTGDICEVDLWSKVDSSYLAYYLADDNAFNIQNIINQDSAEGYYGIENSKSLALYHLYVDLSTEQGLRMITDEQLSETNTLSAELDKYIVYEDMYVTTEDGETLTVPTAVEKPGQGLSTEQLDIGTAYNVYIDSHSRILTGSSYDNLGLRQYSPGLGKYTYPMQVMDTNLGEKINSNEFTTQARKWLFTAGLAENTVAVKYDGVNHVDLTTQSTNENIIEDYERYAILIGVNIIARGDVWNLEYEAFENPQNVLGKSLDTKIPDIIAVYGLSSKEDDFDVEQSH